MHILDVILMRILDVLIRMQILDVLLLLMATTLIAQLFWEFQPQGNNAAGSVVVPKTTMLSITMVLKHKRGRLVVLPQWLNKLHGHSWDPTLPSQSEFSSHVAAT